MTRRPAAPRAPVAITRRTLLGASVAGAVGGIVAPVATARARDEAPLARFMAVSRTLTGQDLLDPAIGGRLRAALVRDRRMAHALGRLEAAGRVDPDDPEAGRAARAVLEGWLLGVAGPEEAPTFVTYTGALMYRAVMDFHNVPGFCGGVPRFWAEAPADRPNPFLEG